MKRLFTIILAIAMVLSFTNTTKAYSDTDSHWAREEINALSNRGVIKGYPDGSFKPDNNVSRAEFLSISRRLVNAKLPVFEQFKDVKLKDWYYDGITQANAMGIAPYLGEYAYPNKAITREEVSISLSLLYGLRPSLITPFSDVGNISDREKVGALYQEGVIKGYPDGSFRPKGLITRAELSSMLNKLLISKGDPSSTYPYALNNVDKSSLKSLMEMAGVSDQSKKSARVIINDSFATNSQVLEVVKKMEMEIESFNKANSERKEEKPKKLIAKEEINYTRDRARFLPHSPISYDYQFYTDPREDLRQNIKNIEDYLNNISNHELRKNIEKTIDHAKKVLNDPTSTQEILIIEKNKLLKLYNALSTNQPMFFMGSEILDSMGRELSLQKGRVYTEEYLKSLVKLLTATEDVTSRVEMRVEPEILNISANTDFTVYFTDPLTQVSTQLKFATFDRTPPVLRNPGVIDISEDTELTMSLLLEKGVNAYDTKDGDISDRIRAMLDGKPLPIRLTEGKYTLELYVEDLSGNGTRDEMEVAVYKVRDQDLTMRFFVDQDTPYEFSNFGESFNPVIKLSREDLSKPLPKFSHIIIKETGEILVKADDKSLVEIEWFIDGVRVSDLSSYEASKKVIAKALNPLKTSSDPVREFNNIEIEVKVIIE